MPDRFCSTYCEHNAEKECDCQPCTFIRTETGGFEHSDYCPWVLDIPIIRGERPVIREVTERFEPRGRTDG